MRRHRDDVTENSEGPEEWLRDLIAVLTAMTDEIFHDWLLDTTRTNGRFLTAPSDLNVPDVLREVAKWSDATLRGRLKRSLAQIVAEYDPQMDGLDVLRELLFSTAFLRISAALPHLGALASRPEFEGAFGGDGAEEERTAVLQAIIGVVHGFLPNEGARAVLVDLLYNDEVPRALVPQLFLAACEGAPSDYTAHVTRFINRMPDDAVETRYDGLRERFVEVITLERIASQWSTIPIRSQGEFYYWLTGGPSPPVEVEPHDESPVTLSSLGGVSAEIDLGFRSIMQSALLGMRRAGGSVSFVAELLAEGRRTRGDQ